MSKLGRSVLCLLAAALPACVEDPDAPELGDEVEELVGGTTTTARPEIGQFFHGNGGGMCTATLVAPRAILTAAHCLSPMYTGTALHANAVFQFTDAGGTMRWHSVDRAYSFTNNRYAYLPGGIFTNDVVLLHLTAAVPANQATPASLAMQEPTTGAQSTTFGFGCTDRTPDNGAQAKQAFPFNFGTTTTALCWGDSGGPAVFGTATGGGAIWGVNSDFDMSDPNADNWPDIFGGVAPLRKQIEDVIRTWDGQGEDGINRPGMDYAALYAGTAAACRSSCQADGNCRAYTWVAGNGVCYLKNGVPEPVPGAGLVSGLAAKTEPLVNRAGNDYAAFWLDEPRVELCAAACARDTACQAYTYKNVNGYGACYLKNAVPTGAFCSTCTSGVMRRRDEVNYNRGGYDYAQSYLANPAACAQACAADERCESYTHTTTGPGWCYLKDAVPWAGSASGMTSGVRRGLETNTDRPGRDYRGFYTTTNHPTTCQAACAREGQCQAWTYVPPGAGSTLGVCWLKSGIPVARTSTAGLVSGVKGFELLP